MQLPVDWYLDPHILDLEKRLLFDQGAGYVGHEIMLPNVGDYYVLEWMNNAKLLVRNKDGIELLSNVCRHRQSVLLKGRGNARNIVCPVHRWTYDMNGTLLGAPHFPENPCLNLGNTPLQNWNGLLFTGKRDVARDMAGRLPRRIISSWLRQLRQHRRVEVGIWRVVQRTDRRYKSQFYPARHAGICQLARTLVASNRGQNTSSWSHLDALLS